MRTLKMVLEYDGSAYHGWQVQPAGPTIQGTLETRLEAILGRPHRVHGAGRTDAGVHARAQVAHVRTEHSMSTEDLQRALNATLPRDIAVLHIAEAPPGFHARKSASGKQYAYYLVEGSLRSVFWDRYAWHVRRSLDLPAMERAAARLVGTHDFSAFCATGCDIADRVRRIDRIEIFRLGDRLRRIEVAGDGFLRHMVRILVGTLVDVGTGRTPEHGVESILAGRDRRAAGRTAPAQGLFLERVEYPAQEDEKGREGPGTGSRGRTP